MTGPGAGAPRPPEMFPGAADLANMHYPDDQDQTIRKYASYIGADGIIHLLDQLRIFVAGDLGKVFRLAETFSSQAKFSMAASRIGDAQIRLTSAWQGDAFDQFNAYSSQAVQVLQNNQSSIVQLANVMGQIANSVVGTYKTLLGFMADCAIALIEVEEKTGSVIINVMLGELQGAVQDVVDAINDAFQKLWDASKNALLDLMSTVGEMVTKEVDFNAIRSGFAELPNVGVSAQVMEDPRRWQVRPGADPS